MYASKQDMIDRFTATELIQLTDRTGAVDAIDDTVLQRALDDADAEIDVFLTPRYTLPLASVPRILVNAACDVARYRLYEDRSTEHVTKRYDDAVKLLKMISRGEISLGLDQAQEPTQSAGGAQYTTPGRVFTRDTLKDY